MFTYHSANTSAAQPALVNAIEQGLRAELGVVTEDDILMELTKWVEASDNGLRFFRVSEFVLKTSNRIEELT